MALAELLTMDLPFKTSVDVVRLSNEIDHQVQEMTQVRNVLLKQYNVKVTKGAEANQIHFSLIDDLGEDEKKRLLGEFSAKIEELSNMTGDDITRTINLPDLPDTIKPELLKPIIGFIE